MNRIIIAIMTLIAVVGISYCGVFSLNRACDELAKSLEEIAEFAVKEDVKSADALTENVISIWEKNEVIISLLVDHREIDEVEETIKSLPVFVRQNDMDKLEEKASTAAERIHHIKDKEKVAIENVW